MADDLKSIWLSPDCGGGLCSDERTWCNDGANDCPDCDAKPVKYIRADLHDGLVKALEEIVDAVPPNQGGTQGAIRKRAVAALAALEGK